MDNGNYAITGVTYSNPKYNWTTQFFTEGLSVEDHSATDNVLNVPNPVSAGTFLTVTIEQPFAYKLISAIGQIIQTGNLSTDSPNKIPIGNAGTGLYFLQLENETGTMIKKIIIQ